MVNVSDDCDMITDNFSSACNKEDTGSDDVLCETAVART